MSTNIRLPNESKQKQLSHALMLQGYCRTILSQEPLSLDKLGNVTNAAEIRLIANKLDQTLGRAKDHARSYLNDLQPKLITDTAVLRGWLSRAETFPESVRTDSNEWKQGLSLLVQETTAHAETAFGTKKALETLRDGFKQDAQEFSELAGRLNTLVSGEQGALGNLDSELGALQTKISGLIAATTLGFLAAAVGVLMMVIGALASPFTAGGTAVLIISGFALTAAGAAGGSLAAVELKNAYDQQRQKLEDRSRLNAAVTFMTGAANGLKSISNSGAAVADATQEMANAWTTLGESINAFKNDLSDENLRALRDWWINTLKADLAALKTDLNRNLDQLAGVQVEHAGNVILFEHPRLIAAAA